MTKVNRLLSIILIGCMLIGIWSNVFYPTNPFVSIIIIGIVIGYFFIKKNFHQNSKLISFIRRNEKQLTIAIFILIVIIQLLIVTFFKASVYHDPFRVLYQADLLSHHNFNWNDSTYFSHCPNNIPLVYLLAQWFDFTRLFKISPNWALNLLCIITVDIFIFLVITIIRKITGKWSGSLKVICFFLFTPLAYTYLLQVFYSDILLLISVCGIWLALINWHNASTRINQGIAIISIILCGLIGMLVKPSIVVLVVSLSITVLFCYNLKNKQKLIIPLISLIIGIGMTPLINQKIVNEVHFSVKAEYQLPVNTWIYMGLNPQTAGTYSRSDIKQIERIPQTKRFKETNKFIQQRIKKLGIIGILKQWVSKIEICENCGTVQGAYMSGNYHAPTWFLKWQTIIATISSIIFRSTIILIMFKIIKQCSYFDKQLNWLSFFTKLSILGFIAFYSIIWEAEGRYGLVLIPLYLILISIPKKGDFLHATRQSSSAVIFNGLILGILILNLFASNISLNIDNFSGVITAQNSQLSSFYKAKLTKLKPHSTISEQVELPQPANDFSMIVPQNSKIKIDLILPNKQVIHLNKKSGVAFYHGTLHSGMYQIKVSNSTSQKQTSAIVTPSSYQLATYPIKGDSLIKNGYFIYSFENRRLK